MSKWIAEFELEDGDTMPEHMDLEYKGAKIDFHCRPMWIPCSERLPEKYGEYLITYKSNGKQIFMDIIEYETSFEYDYEKNGFKGVWLFDGNRQDVNSEVIAWMPLPEYYREEG